MGPTAELSEITFPMAIMSTQPSDYPIVKNLAAKCQPTGVPAFGVHPWWLHELTARDWDYDDGEHVGNGQNFPKWVRDLQRALIHCPEAAVGETGLDGFHFDPHTKKLTCPMDIQLKAFRYHLELARDLDRSVSVHCVRSFGPLMETLSDMKRSKRLPRRIYFHAFGGKEGMIDQLASICDEIYFGFAPVVNFRSPKTAKVVRKVGIGRIVLETDHEDAKYVVDSMNSGIQFLSIALNVQEHELIKRTTENAIRLYGLNPTSHEAI